MVKTVIKCLQLLGMLRILNTILSIMLLTTLFISNYTDTIMQGLTLAVTSLLFLFLATLGWVYHTFPEILELMINRLFNSDSKE